MLPVLVLVCLQSPAAHALAGSQPLGAVDLPLTRLPGVDPFNSAGVSFLDYDGDGWSDLYVNASAGLWRNLGGTTFVRVADLDVFLPPIVNRYGASCGDYDNDGLPDIACSPRGDCFFLLHNLGVGVFQEVAGDPAIVEGTLSCQMYGESFAWADVDADGDIDLWLTAYPDDVSPGSGGNQFLENLGPTGPGGAYRFAVRTQESGLFVPDNVNRPEGAQFVDVDRDGDTDGFANNTVYQNVCAGSAPRFLQLVRNVTGITLANVLDEGTVFLDHDLDGDPDLVCLYRGRNVLWENRGDGTFFDASERLETPASGATEGCSAEDWDLDGDLDLSTAAIFRRNLLVETGTPFLRLATTSINESFLNFCQPAWSDWDKDGDMDCALGNFSGRSAFFRNTTYTSDTPALQKVALRVRAVRASATLARGLETEFGATVELRVHGDTSGFVRRRFVAASHGYSQQSEYALTLALPSGPDADAPARGVVFDLLVDFPELAGNGILRIDRDVNPVLGELELETLSEREITVFRDGAVLVDGALVPPRAAFAAHLSSTGALVLPAPGVVLDDLQPAPASPWFVGLELDTRPVDAATRVAELVLDGQLTPSGAGRCDANVQLWDVTPGEPPRLVRAESRASAPRNRRSFLALDWLLKPQRIYRVLCRVSALRASPATSGFGPLAVNGALSFELANPCDGAAFAAAPLLTDARCLELRYRAGAPLASAKGTRR
ncbi:MAG: VCBS repeat-containing protein [Planctomycetes bacterium]|nr:VCBS repeat-containing protein [Planctomycetota bacterium]